MTVAHVHCDIEQLLIGWTPTVITARALTETPDDLVDVITNVGGVVQVTRIGGGNGAPGFDYPTVALDCFGLTRPAAKKLSYDLNAALLYQLPGFSNPYGTVLTVQTISGPSWLPYTNTNVRRFGSTHRIAVHASS